MKALSRLGLEDCFEGIICFETLNPIHKNINVTEDEDEIFETINTLSPTTSNSINNNNGSEIFDIIAHFAQPNADTSVLPKTPIICKPQENAIKLALDIANLNPQRTVRIQPKQHNFNIFTINFLRSFFLLTNTLSVNCSCSLRIVCATFKLESA